MATRKTDRRVAARRVESVIIEGVSPEIDGGRYPAKRIVGDVVSVGANLIKEGRDCLAAWVLCKAPGDVAWRTSPMTYEAASDRWYGAFTADRIGRWAVTIEAATDAFETWRRELEKKHDAGDDVSVDLLDGAILARSAARSTRFGDARSSLLETASELEDELHATLEHRVQRAMDEDFLTLMRRHLRPTDLTRYSREVPVVVDRAAARFGAWYEMFPRSQVPVGDDRHGSFADAARRLPQIADLKFDVVCLPPIHPIGHTFRKGKDNSLTPSDDDVGSPWAIGNVDGGHTAIEPTLGTLDDFDDFVAAATNLGLEIALDLAYQCSPDHPWVKEHPEWFHIRADGSIKPGEYPPETYEDVYPLNFWCDDREALWAACRDVLSFWIDHGVKIFSINNPHLNALVFWERTIAEVQNRHPDVIFLAEAFTRPKRMKTLAKLGFSMSYTYFPWKNTEWDLRQYFAELTQTAMAEYYRGNLFPTTPDILNEYFINGALPAFRARLLLAATLSPLYGIYSGYELGENAATATGREGYLHSEKYELRPRDYDAPGNLNSDVRRLNAIRRAQPALQQFANLSFHISENPAILFYRKAARTPVTQWLGCDSIDVPLSVIEALNLDESGSGGDLLIAVNTDPHHAHETMVHVPISELGLSDDEPYVVHDLLTDARYTWRGVRNYVRLDPAQYAGHVLLVERG